MSIRDLNQMNSVIKGIESFKRMDNALKNICFIVALPRAGSTLLNQVMISRYDVGYASNIIGKFWGNPVLGTIVHSSLADKEYISNFLSVYGNTKGPFEPCEFGWFWKHALDVDPQLETIGREVDWIELNETLQSMASVFSQPVIFDVPFACSQIARIAEKLEVVKVIYLTRNLWSVCNSILSARMTRHGDIHHYYGAKPKSWLEISQVKDPVLQVVKQVAALKSEIEAELKQIHPADVYTVDISEIREQPSTVADGIAAFLGVESLPRNVVFPTFIDRDKVPLFDISYEKRFSETFGNIFGT